MSPAAPIAIFLHQPKTAGTTVRTLFRRNLPAEAIWEPSIARDLARQRYFAYLNGAEVGLGDPDRNARWLALLRQVPPEELDRIRALVGHFWFGLHDALADRPSVYVTILRDPVERVLSLYHHRRAHHGLDQPLEAYVREGRDFEAVNGQCRRVAGGPRARIDVPVDDGTLELAKSNIRDRFAVVGLTERFEESLSLIALALGWRKVAYEVENRSTGRLRAADVDPSTVAQIRERNRFDVDLHRFASELMDARIEAAGAAFDAAIRRVRRQVVVERRAPRAVLRGYRRAKAVAAAARRAAAKR